MDYLTLCLSRYILSNQLYILLFAIQPSECLVCYQTCVYILCYISNSISCSMLSNHLLMLYRAILPSACLVLCYPTAIYGLFCLLAATHLVTVCFPKWFKSSDLRRCSSHLAVLVSTTYITTILLYLTSDTVPGCAR